MTNSPIVSAPERSPAATRPLARLALLGMVLAAGAPAAFAQGSKATAKPPAATAAPAAAAPVSADPAATSASYGDWVLRCQKVGDGDKAQRVCEVSQTIQLQNQRDPFAEIAMGHLANEPALRVTVALPPSVSFPSTVEIAATTAGPAAMQLQWHRCVPGGCFADGVPSEEVLKTLRGTTGAGKLTFKDASGREIALPLSFRGLAQALDALAKA